jgi:hypothetical protein
MWEEPTADPANHPDRAVSGERLTSSVALKQKVEKNNFIFLSTHKEHDNTIP